MRRTLAVPSALAALLVAAAVPLLGSATAAACPSWTDPKGDASTGMLPNDAGVIGDDNLDITATTLKSDGTNITATITAVKVSSSSSDMGDEHRVGFTIGGKSILLYSDRTIISGVKMPYGNYVGFYNLTDRVDAGGGTATYDVKTSTVTITSGVAILAKALGSPVEGKAATNIKGETFNQVDGGTVAPYDVAPAPAGTTVTLGQACGGAGGPAPTTPPTSAPPTSSPSPSPSPTAPAACFDVVDPKGDAPPFADAKPAIANDPDLDIVGVTYQATADKFVTYIKVDKLATRAAQATGHSFYSDFTFNKVLFSVFAATYDPAAIGQARNTAAGASAGLLLPTAQFRAAGSYKADVPVETKFDLATSTVTLSVPRAGITKYAGGATFTDGAELTLVTARSRADIAGLTPVGGDATGNAESKLLVGENKCFGPPPAKLLNAGRTTVQYTDAAALATKLTDSAGKPLAGKTVTFAIGAAKRTATTGADGIARASLAPGVVAGAYTLVTSFAGDATAAKVETTTPFTVTAEATRIVLSVARSGTKRTVTARLLDDDGKAVAGQNVNWYINGRKVSTMRTNSAGAVVLTTAKPTQTVLAEFLAVAGKYTASKASARV